MTKEEWLEGLDPQVKLIRLAAKNWYISNADYDTLSDEWQLACRVLDLFNEYYEERYNG